MKKVSFLFIAVFSLSMIAYGANDSDLVVNGSFEDLNGAKGNGPGGFRKAFRVSSSNNTTVDLYSSDKKHCNRNYRAPENQWGTQSSFEGENYAGITAYYHDEAGIFKTKPGYQRYSEYIQLELKEPLVAGKAYTISFRASLAEKSGYAVSGLGVYFSQEKMDVDNNAFLNVTPHMITSQILTSNDWETVSGTYVAQGGEKYLTLGGFSQYMTKVKVVPDNVNNSRKAYYYIDGVSMMPDGDSRPEDLTVVLFGSCFQLQDLNFELDKAVILPESFDELHALSSFLRTYPYLVVYIDGHTDKTGTEEYNAKLSEDRAIAVREFLVRDGVGDYQLKTRGYGESQPIEDTNDPSAINRRVEIVICPVATR